MSSIEEVKQLQIPLQELSDATNGFSEQNRIGSGGFGYVYKGVSEKHGTMAIKMLDRQLGGQGNREFRTEIALLSVYKHENIVSLVGFCDEAGKKILVYKYESHGSLNRYLKNKDLTWIQRLQICLDAARGLHYLHDDVGHQHQIIHRDIKSANILLDDNWKAKIADFGLSRETQASFVITNGCGTLGYTDPDYNTNGYLTEKSDVYSFGVVLFEVLCGRPACDSKKREEYELLTNLIKTRWRRKKIYEIIHPELQEQIKPASLLTFSSTAYQCLMSSNERPTMKKVVEQLQKALDNQLAPSFSLSDDGDSTVLIGGLTGLLASSSHESSLASSSQASPYSYDVFISSRENNRHPFVAYLYYALVKRGIRTFVNDEKLHQGENINPLLIKATQESRIAIIIFSPIYASSFRCLDELACIKENKVERGQIVIPIFAGVEPTEVRKQTGHYARPIFMDGTKNIKRVQSWRNALVEAASLPGEKYLNGHETNLVQRIGDKVLLNLTSLMTQSEANAEASATIDVIGIETRIQELKSLVKEVGSGGVHMIGICGMWGSGKSTLASSIYDRVNKEFEGCCLVENFRAELRTHGLKSLQEKILSDVLKTNVTLKSTEQGIRMMEKSLFKNSVLIVLDDVDHLDHLKMFAASKSWFGNGSLIMITTRNQDLVKAGGFLTHNVRMLDAKEAIKLFSRHAFGTSRPSKGFEDVSLNMVSKLGGHPSALISLGSFLHGKNMSEWMSILYKLEAIPVDGILKKFKIRDDGVVRDISDWLLP